MCGIAGLINYATKSPVDSVVIKQMASSIAHRGPDDEGFYFSNEVGLAFRRLSIIDLEGGHQPMSDERQLVWVVFNGEIYNYKELRTELERNGHVFRTQSDTEVLVHGYKEWGPDVFSHLNGMFGVAIWDTQKRRLVVARDPMGIKMVYYQNQDGRLAFGSEIRPLIAATGKRPAVDPVAVNLFLRFRYTPAPLTIYKGIRKLAAGSMLIVENGVCAERRWYNYTPTPFEPPFTDDAAQEELLGLYRAAVKRHLLADVPVGILLSGGLDSGLLLALMGEYGKDWPAYTVGYGSAFKDDELGEAAESARLLGAKHVPVQLNRAEFEESLPKIVEFLEEPIASSSIVPMYFVCARARQDVKVALIGQGPDELFGGYNRHLGVAHGNSWRALPKPLRHMATFAIELLPRSETAKRGVQSLGNIDRLLRYQNVFSLAPAADIRTLFLPGRLDGLVDDEVVEYWKSLEPQMASLDDLGGFQLLEVRSSLPDELLMFGDKLSMAHGLEARVPYLDRTVVEFVQRLGSNQKIRGMRRKFLHREVCKKCLPDRILHRRKRGFAVNVVDEWFHSSMEGKLPDMLRDPNSAIYTFLDHAAVNQLLREHHAGREDNHKLLFSIAMLEQLLRQPFTSVR